MLRIVGIDPGSVATGFGVVEKSDGGDGGAGLRHIAHGTLRPTRGKSLAARLAFIHAEICQVIERYEPDIAVVERVFVSTSVRSALVLGQARGAALVALGAAGLPIHELAPRAIKQAVAGSGSANKGQVQRAVVRALALKAKPGADAADALAAAICQAGTSRLASLGVAAPSRRRSQRRWSSVPAPLRGGAS